MNNMTLDTIYKTKYYNDGDSGGDETWWLKRQNNFDRCVTMIQ